MSATGLTLDSVSHAYGDRKVVRDVSLRVAAGELLCLLGPSGCGKTTTLRIAAGLETPRAGRVLLDGEVVSGDGVHVPPERRHVGFLFQDYALFPHLSVRANVEFGLDRLPRARRRARALEVLDQVGMADHAESWPHRLSGGQQQRVALARALAPRPRLMLLDEPFSGLDKRLRDQVRDETLSVLKGSGVCALMVTHDPEEAMVMADRIAVMRDGAVVQMGSPAELYDHPAEPFVAAAFGEVNVLSGRASGGRVETVLGAFAAPDLDDGAEAEVLIRPEGLTPVAGEAALVESAHALGRSCLLRLLVGGTRLSARVAGAGAACPMPGSRVGLEVDLTQAFVFSRDG